MRFEALEERWLLTAATSKLPPSYADWIPEAVRMAEEFLVSNPTLTGDVESWFAEEDAAEAASGIKVTFVEMHLPHDLVPPDMSVELVEEMMEELIENRTTVQDVVEVIFNNVPSDALDARLALRTQSAGSPSASSTVRSATSSEVESGDIASADQPAVEESAVSDPTIAVEAAKEIEAVEADVDGAASDDGAAAAAFRAPVDASGEATADSLAPKADAQLPVVSPANSRPTFLDHLKADMRAVDRSLDALLDELEVLRRDLADWLEEPPMPLWAKVTIGGAAMVAAWRELRRWRERRKQPDEEAIDWIFLHSLDHDGAAS